MIVSSSSSSFVIALTIIDQVVSRNNYIYIYMIQNCLDIDECKGPNICGERTCVNGPGMYKCDPKITKPEEASVLQGEFEVES